MKRLLICALLALCLCASTLGISAVAFADDAPVEISTVAEFMAINGVKGGNYVLTDDIVLADGACINSFEGNLDGQGHTITINNERGLFLNYGNGTLKNFTVAGNVTNAKEQHTASVVVAAYSCTLKGITVTVDLVSHAQYRVGGFANCNAKEKVVIEDCVFAGTVTYAQGFTSSTNYGYWGIFYGYNGGIFGGGWVENSIARYTLTLPTSEVSSIANVEFFNVFNDENNSKVSSYTTKVEGENTVYTFDCVVNMDPVTVASINDMGIMAHYGTPVVRLVLADGTYRYLDGYDRANGMYISNFGTKSLNTMYEYEDISDLEIRTITEQSVTESYDGNEATVTSKYTEVTLSSAAEFESFARIINSVIPATFIDAETKQPVTSTVLNTLAIRVKLGADIDLSKGDRNGNHSEFYGLGKQEFFPYRGGIDGGGHTLTVDIYAPNGYCIGLIGSATEMAEDVYIKNLKVEGTIVGKTKVGLVGYYDMVANEFITGGNMVFENVTNNAKITGSVGVGGMLGVLSTAKDVNKVFVKNCVNNGTVTVEKMYGGGIIGTTGFYSGHSCGVVMENVTNNGDVIGTNAKFVGGIVGQITNNFSTAKNVENNGNVTGSSYFGGLMGSTGALKIDSEVEAGEIGNYTASNLSSLDSIKFANTAMTSTYGIAYYTVSLSGTVTNNYSLRLIFTDEQGNKVAFKDAEGNTVYEREKGATGVFTVKLDPGVYTVQIIARDAEGYYNTNSTGEQGKLLASTATYTVNKKNLSYTFSDVVAAYTGSAVNYLDVCGIETALPDADGQWNVEYYKDGAKVDEVKAGGVYEVKINLVGNEAFNKRYNYSADVQTVTMTVKSIMTVKLNALTITEGEQAEFAVTVTTSDGVEYTDLAALGLSYSLTMFGTADTTQLATGMYDVTVSGNAQVGTYDVEYEGAKLTVIAKQAPVTPPAPTNPSAPSGGGASGGCGLSMSTSLIMAVAFIALGGLAIKRKNK